MAGVELAVVLGVVKVVCITFCGIKGWMVPLLGIASVVVTVEAGMPLIRGIAGFMLRWFCMVEGIAGTLFIRKLGFIV